MIMSRVFLSIGVAFLKFHVLLVSDAHPSASMLVSVQDLPLQTVEPSEDLH